MARREYTDEDKQSALDAFDDEGIRAACEKSGAHNVTIYRWHAERLRRLKETPDEMAAERDYLESLRTHLKRRLLESALTHIDRSVECTEGRDARGFMTAAAIAVDKFRLESGEVTDRTEHGIAESAKLRLAEVLGVAPEDVPDELARRRAEKRQAS